jgi:hypothetical protein
MATRARSLAVQAVPPTRSANVANLANYWWVARLGLRCVVGTNRDNECPDHPELLRVCTVFDIMSLYFLYQLSNDRCGVQRRFRIICTALGLYMKSQYHQN